MLVKRSRYYQPMKKPPTNCHPLVREMFELMELRAVTHRDLMRRAGLGSRTLDYWKKVSSPRVTNLEAALNTIGFRLAILPMEDRP